MRALEDGVRDARCRGGNPESYVMNVDGSQQTRLTENLVVDWWPAWSP